MSAVAVRRGLQFAPATVFDDSADTEILEDVPSPAKRSALTPDDLLIALAASRRAQSAPWRPGFVADTYWMDESLFPEIADQGKAADAAIRERLLRSLLHAANLTADFEFPLAPPLSVRTVKATFRLVEGLGPLPLDDLD